MADFLYFFLLSEQEDGDERVRAEAQRESVQEGSGTRTEVQGLHPLVHR